MVFHSHACLKWLNRNSIRAIRILLLDVSDPSHLSHRCGRPSALKAKPRPRKHFQLLWNLRRSFRPIIRKLSQKIQSLSNTLINPLWGNLLVLTRHKGNCHKRKKPCKLHRSRLEDPNLRRPEVEAAAFLISITWPRITWWKSQIKLTSSLKSLRISRKPSKEAMMYMRISTIMVRMGERNRQSRSRKTRILGGECHDWLSLLFNTYKFLTY